MSRELYSGTEIAFSSNLIHENCWMLFGQVLVFEAGHAALVLGAEK